MGFRVIGEYLSQIDSILRVKFKIDSILRRKFKIDSQYRVKLTQIFSNYSESHVEFKFHEWLSFLGQNDSIFSFSVHELGMSGTLTLRP